jgi:tetratricopeptide (TPR) repeat protein
VAAALLVAAACGERREASPDAETAALLDAAGDALARGTPEGRAAAAAKYRDALARSPASAEARYGLGLAELESGRLWAGLWHFTRLRHENPGHAGALHRLGLLAYSQGRSEDAVELLRSLATVRPLDDEEAAALADACNRINRFAEAESLLAAVLDRPGAASAPRLLEARGYSRWKLGRLEEGAADFARAKGLGPRPPVAALQEAMILADLGRLEEAGSVLGAVPADEAKAAGILAGVVTLHNRILLRRGPPSALPGARAELEALLRDEPENVDALHLLAQVRRRLGDVAGAREAGERHRAALVSVGRPERALAMKELVQGAIAEESGDLEAALAAYRSGLAEDPKNPHLHCAAGAVLAALDRREEARVHFAELRSIGGVSPADHFLESGRELRRRGLAAAAARRFELAVSRAPESEEAVWFRALALAEAGNWDAALDAAAPLEAPRGSPPAP